MIHLHRVTYADCTVGNHVYYARYLDVMEAARGEHLRALGFPFAELDAQDVALPVVRVELDCKAPAHYDDLLQVETQVQMAGRVRLVFHYRITREDGTLIAEGSTLHGITTGADRPRRLPAALAEVLEGH